MGQGAEAHAARARALGCAAVAATVAPQDLIMIADLEVVIYAGYDAQKHRRRRQCSLVGQLGLGSKQTPGAA